MKIKALIASIVVVLIILASATFFLLKEKAPEETEEEIEEQIAWEHIVPGTGFSEDFVANQTAELKQKMLGLGYNFVTELSACGAVVKDSMLNCDMITMEREREDCRKKAREYIDQVNSVRGNCNYNFSDPQKKEGCMAFSAGDCSMLSEDPPLKFLCEAVINKNPDACDGSAFCEQNRAYLPGKVELRRLIAARNNEPSFCSGIESIAERVTCEGIAKGDCTEADETIYRDIFLILQGRTLNKTSFCDTINNPGMKAICIDESIGPTEAMAEYERLSPGND